MWGVLRAAGGTSWPPQEKIIRSLFRVGQVPFIESAVRVMQECGESVPRSREGLLEIKGVGEKIAECIAAYGWGGEALPLDGNGIRVIGRICGQKGNGRANHPRQLRSRLKEIYRGHRGWMEKRGVAMIDIHEMLRLHGQVVCTRTPDCRRCPVSACGSRRHAFAGSWNTGVDPELWREWRELLLDPAGDAETGR